MFFHIYTVVPRHSLFSVPIPFTAAAQLAHRPIGCDTLVLWQESFQTSSSVLGL